ncbi:LysR family transcriptional regulator [Oricola sp.]|uniref:LysR family transcriptional regulator n=1 Tax=Oricola sp. TaxID=1979950 RepID=UPI003BA94FA9
MDVRHLRLFMTVVDRGSITAAAEELGLSQPALSKHLSRLEAELETKLLVRLPRGVRPSRTGQILFDYAKSIDASYRSALRQIDGAKEAQIAEITIGSGYFWLTGFLPKAVALLVGEHPDIRVNIETGVPTRLKDKLLSGDLDLVFGPVALSGANQNMITSESLIRTDSHVLVRQGHPAQDGKDKSIKDLLELSWALPNGTFVRSLFDQLFQAHGVPAPTPTVDVNDVSCSLEVVARSDLATLATSLTPEGQAWTQFDHLKCSALSGFRETGILRRKFGVIPPMAEALCEKLRIVSRDHRDAVR